MSNFATPWNFAAAAGNGAAVRGVTTTKKKGERK